MGPHVDRRHVLLTLVGAATAVLGLPRRATGQPAPTMIVYKDPSCGCCQEWVNHATANGYRATVIKADMGPIKVKHQIPASLQSCHTTLIGGYVIEGHVPVSYTHLRAHETVLDLVCRLLLEKKTNNLYRRIHLA